MQIAPSRHAICRPSSAYRWAACPGSVGLSHGAEDLWSEASDIGTACHAMAASVLNDRARGLTCAQFVGMSLPIGATTRVVEIDDEMAEHAQHYVDGLRKYLALADEYQIEAPLDISPLTGETDALGTADAVVFFGNELQIHDAKFGYIPVRPENNAQLMTYAAAKYIEVARARPIVSIRLVIHQPRVYQAPLEWSLTPQTLSEFAKKLRPVAQAAIWSIGKSELQIREAGLFKAGADQCEYCPARFSCKTIEQSVITTITQNAADLHRDPSPGIQNATTQVAQADIARLVAVYDAIPLIDIFTKAVAVRLRREVEANRVPQYKLVAGRKGRRKWLNDVDVEQQFQRMRLRQDEMYTYRLISPTRAEELFGKSNPNVWKRMQGWITQAPGVPVLAKADDIRPAIQTTLDAFQVLPSNDNSIEDLFQ